MTANEEADEYERRIKRDQLRRRALGGTALVALGLGGLLALGLLAAQEGTSLNAPGSIGAIKFVSFALSSIALGVLVLRSGFPAPGGHEPPVPMSMVLRVLAAGTAVTALIVAGPLGIYQQAWWHVLLWGGPCHRLVNADDMRAVGGPIYRFSDAEASDTHCAFELAPPRPDVPAGLRVEVHTDWTKQRFDREVYSYGRDRQPISGLAGGTTLVRRRGGHVLCLWCAGNAAVIQLPRPFFDSRSTQALVHRLRSKREVSKCARGEPWIPSTMVQ